MVGRYVPFGSTDVPKNWTSAHSQKTLPPPPHQSWNFFLESREKVIFSNTSIIPTFKEPNQVSDS